MFRGSNSRPGQVIRSSPNLSFTSSSEQTPARASGALPSVSRPSTTKDEPGVFAGYIGDGVDKNKQFPQGRYTISNKLGSGTYGKVLGCVDKKYNLPVAIKIVRKDPPIYKEAAKKEIAVLRHLGGTHGCLRLLRDFEHDGHLCISMEMYGENLQAFMKRKGQPFELQAVADIGLQLVHACEYMHVKQIIHTDIKCENILLAAGPEGSYTIKLVDMGSSLFTSWWHPPIIGTMEYRAPETLLQAGWSCPVDNFAAGCVLAELVTGEYLLPGLREEEHLKAIEVVMEARIPQNMMQLGRKNMNQYNQKLILRRGQEYCIPEVSLQYPIRKLRAVIKDPQILSLCHELLQIDPANRLTAGAAKQHPFFQLSTFDVQKMDDAFCLQTRNCAENDSSSLDNASKESTQVPSIPIDGFAEYSFVDETVVEDDSHEDIIEGSPIIDDIHEEPAPPSRAPPPAPKPLVRSLADSDLREEVTVKKEQRKAQRAALPGASVPSRELPPLPPPRLSLGEDTAGPPANKPPLPPALESVHASAVTPSKAPQLLAKSTEGRRNTSPSRTNHYISPMLGAHDPPSGTTDVQGSRKGANKYISPILAALDSGAQSSMQQKSDAWDAALAAERGRASEERALTTLPLGTEVHSPYKQIPTPSKQIPQSATHVAQHGTLAEFPGLQAVPDSDQSMVHRVESRAVRAAPPASENTPNGAATESVQHMSPGDRPSGFISGILTNLTSAVKTSIASPSALETNNLTPPRMQDENTQFNSSRSRERAPVHELKADASNLLHADYNLSTESEADESINWECDLSDRLARLHERLTRLRHENSVWAEGSKSRRSKGRLSVAEAGLAQGNSSLSD